MKDYGQQSYDSDMRPNMFLYQKDRMRFARGCVSTRSELFIGNDPRKTAPLVAVSTCEMGKGEAFKFSVSADAGNMTVLLNPKEKTKIFKAAVLCGQSVDGSWDGITCECDRNSHETKVLYEATGGAICVCREERFKYEEYVYVNDGLSKGRGNPVFELYNEKTSSFGWRNVFLSGFGFGRNCVARVLPGFVSIWQESANRKTATLIFLAILMHQKIVEPDAYPIRTAR